MTDISQLKEWYIRTLNLPVADPDAIDEHETLQVDSVDAVLLADAIERDFGIVIDTVAQARQALSSLNGLAAFIEESAPEREQFRFK